MAWEQLPGSAQDIGVGPDGEVWVIGRDQGIYRWNGRDWDRVEGAAVRIAVGPEGPLGSKPGGRHLPVAAGVG